MKAAEAIAQALQGDDEALPRYSDVMNREWGEEMRWARRLARVVYQAPGLVYRLGVKRPSSTLTMTKIFTGELRYADVVQRAVDRLVINVIRHGCWGLLNGLLSPADPLRCF